MEKSRTIYCHFSFKRPKDKGYGLFAVAFYKDFEGKKKIIHETVKLDLWKDHQFVTAIQAYANALEEIHKFQGVMMRVSIGDVMLVTDNSILAGWILNPKKNKDYTEYMRRAVEPYRVGSHKEIVVGVGLCEPRDYEKSYKYCKEEFVSNEEEYRLAHLEVENAENEKKNRFKLDESKFIPITEMVKKEKIFTEIEGIKSV